MSVHKTFQTKLNFSFYKIMKNSRAPGEDGTTKEILQLWCSIETMDSLLGSRNNFRKMEQHISHPLV